MNKAPEETRGPAVQLDDDLNVPPAARVTYSRRAVRRLRLHHVLRRRRRWSNELVRICSRLVSRG